MHGTSCSRTREYLLSYLPLRSVKLTLSTRSLFGYFFRTGQVLCTDRGRGVFQPSIDKSIDLLEAGAWVHIFPEGYVNMSRKSRCRRFKWGVGRMLLEAGRSAFSKSAGPAESALAPLVVPIWITGETRSNLLLDGVGES